MNILPDYDISPGEIHIHSLPGELNIVELVNLFISNATPEGRRKILESFVLSKEPLDDGKRHKVAHVIFSRVMHALPKEIWIEDIKIPQEEKSI